MGQSRFAGFYNATDYAYGVNPLPPALIVDPGSANVTSTLTLAAGFTTLFDGTVLYPLSTNAPITVGIGASAETVTPTAVSGSNNPAYQSNSVTAPFANAHGVGDRITSGTCGLQEAINYANGKGGGTVVVDIGWSIIGGTNAMLAAAVIPANGSVTIEDNRGSASNGFTYWAYRATSGVIAAPSAATSSTVASQPGIVGTWTAITEHVLFTYVTATGGETLASSDFPFTATASVAIGGSGPAAATGAVGYRVYIGANATTTCYQVPTIAANGTILQAGPTACFAIGTPFSVATATTSAGNLIPNVSTAFGTVLSQPQANFPVPFPQFTGPYAVTGVVTAGTALELGRVPLPTGYLNFIGRTLRVTFDAYYTPVSTATLIINVLIASVYGTTSTTIFTVTTPASSGTTAAVINGTINIKTAAVGTSGTVECHGNILYGGATGTAGLLVAAGDSVITVSSAIDLTKQDFMILQINSGTANLTQSQLRALRIEVLA